MKSLTTLEQPSTPSPCGVMATPALVVDDEVVLAGRVPTCDEIRRLLAER